MDNIEHLLQYVDRLDKIILIYADPCEMDSTEAALVAGIYKRFNEED